MKHLVKEHESPGSQHSLFKKESLVETQQDCFVIFDMSGMCPFTFEVCFDIVSKMKLHQRNISSSAVTSVAGDMAAENSLFLNDDDNEYTAMSLTSPRWTRSTPYGFQLPNSRSILDQRTKPIGRTVRSQQLKLASKQALGWYDLISKKSKKYVHYCKAREQHQPWGLP